MSPMQYFFDWLGSLDWGTVPDFLAAIGTIGAVVVALFLASKGARDQLERDKRLQASCVSIWRNVRTDNGQTVSLNILNKSKATIFDIAISFGVSAGAGFSYQTGNENHIFIRALPPGRHIVPAPRVPEVGMHVEIAPAITFRDAQGIYWRRDAQGNLYETDPQEPYANLEILQPITKFESFNALDT